MYNILTIPNEKLRKVANPVTDISNHKETLSSLCASMYETMNKVRGVGLAATQIGVDLNIAVAKINGNPYFFINPVILHEEGEQKVVEGCLSVPYFTAMVTRPRKIEVKWDTIEGSVNQEIFEGFNACIVKHELDHLVGKLFIDYLPEYKREKARKKVEIWKRRQKKQK